MQIFQRNLHVTGQLGSKEGKDSMGTTSGKSKSQNAGKRQKPSTQSVPGAEAGPGPGSVFSVAAKAAADDTSLTYRPSR